MWFPVLESGQILSDFIILRKIPVGFPSDPMRSDYRIDGPGMINHFIGKYFMKSFTSIVFNRHKFRPDFALSTFNVR
jgi:hypothetical protein